MFFIISDKYVVALQNMWNKLLPLEKGKIWTREVNDKRALFENT